MTDIVGAQIDSATPSIKITLLAVAAIYLALVAAAVFAAVAVPGFITHNPSPHLAGTPATVP